MQGDEKLIFYSMFFPQLCMSLLNFLPPSVNWHFILYSYRGKRKMQRPIDVSVIHWQLLTVFQLDDHTRQLSRFLSISSNSLYASAIFRLSSDFPYSIWVPAHFLQHKWIASSYFVLVFISRFFLGCPRFLPVSTQHHDS
jgi:hypothetical protein